MNGWEQPEAAAQWNTLNAAVRDYQMYKNSDPEFAKQRQGAAITAMKKLIELGEIESERQASHIIGAKFPISDERGDEPAAEFCDGAK